MGAMVATAATGKAALAVEEARLARAAAAGDGSAFATLYERYARRAYNLAYRLTGSEEDAADAVQDAFLNVMRRLPRLGDRELAFGSYLFTATRNASYDLMSRQRRARPSDSIPESAVPVGGGAGGLGLDPGDPEEDPDRRQLLASQQDEVREANGRLPERQREALALRELEDLSYDEIAAVMGMNRNSVAQLISRARINLRDELRGTALASVAASSPGCERALPLIAMRDDGQLDDDSGDAAWLEEHLAGCEPLPRGDRGDAGGRRLLPGLGADRDRPLAVQGDDGQRRRAERGRLERGDRGALGETGGGRVAAGHAARRTWRLARTGGGRRAAAAPPPSRPWRRCFSREASPPCWRAAATEPAPAPSQPAAAGHPASGGAAPGQSPKSHGKRRRKRSGESEPAGGRPGKATTTAGATTAGAPAPAPQDQAGSQGGGSPESASHPSGGSVAAGLKPTKPTSKHAPASRTRSRAGSRPRPRPGAGAGRTARGHGTAAPKKNRRPKNRRRSASRRARAFPERFPVP